MKNTNKGGRGGTVIRVKYGLTHSGGSNHTTTYICGIATAAAASARPGQSTPLDRRDYLSSLVLVIGR